MNDRGVPDRDGFHGRAVSFSKLRLALKGLDQTMPVYLVTWDLNKEKPNYAEARRQFIAHLERYDNKKDSGLDCSFHLNILERDSGL